MVLSQTFVRPKLSMGHRRKAAWVAEAARLGPSRSAALSRCSCGRMRGRTSGDLCHAGAARVVKVGLMVTVDFPKGEIPKWFQRFGILVTCRLPHMYSVRR